MTGSVVSGSVRGLLTLHGFIGDCQDRLRPYMQGISCHFHNSHGGPLKQLHSHSTRSPAKHPNMAVDDITGPELAPTAVIIG